MVLFPLPPPEPRPEFPDPPPEEFPEPFPEESPEPGLGSQILFLIFITECNYITMQKDEMHSLTSDVSNLKRKFVCIMTYDR